MTNRERDLAYAQRQRIQRGQAGAIRRYGHLAADELRERAAAGTISPYVAQYLLSRAKVQRAREPYSTGETEPDGGTNRTPWRGQAPGASRG